MTGETEAAGALATAGVVAGAIEGGDPGAPKEGDCANCGAAVSGRYCANCGQATHGNRSLIHMVADFGRNLFHLDTKLWRTAPMTLFRPGTLTRNYVFGRRARYISPLAMFLFSIFLMFFAFSYVDAPVTIGGTPAEQREHMTAGLEAARAEVARAERELATAQAAPPADDGSPPGLDVRLAEQAVRLAREEVARREQAIARIDRYIAERGAAAASGEPVEIRVEESAGAEGLTWEPGETWQDGMRRLAQSEDFTIVSGMPELNERVRRKFENPDLALFQIQEAASKYAFLLAPMSLPFIALLFLWKRGVTLYDHIVYALYALAFAALLFVAVIAVSQSAWTRWLAGWLVLLVLPVHTFFHLKGAYALGWWSALWRTLFMLLFAIVIASVFVSLVVILGLAG